MVDSPGLPKDATDNGSPNDGLAELRKLLLGKEQEEIVHLTEQLESQKINAMAVGELLPAAIVLSRKNRDFTKALLPSIEDALAISIRKNPRVLIDIIFPVLGPAIRKAVAASLSGMIESLNQVLEHSFSWQGMKWRWEAFTLRKPYAEVVLWHTLRYRVEQVFLIHRETGIMLQHVVETTGTVQDPDMVSGMLTAIQDFVHDSFGTSQGEQLETLQVGELSVWVEQGPYAVLAVVIRGSASASDLREILQDTIASVHLESGEELKAFQGDTAAFERVRPQLENCLKNEYKPSTTQAKKQIPYAWLLLAVVGLLILTWFTFYLRDEWRWGAYLNQLKTQPGIVITSTEKRQGKFVIYGLRDPLAIDPATVECRLAPEQIESHWRFYQSLDNQFVLLRSQAILAPPSTLEMKFENGALYLNGMATQAWLMDARKLVRALPGVLRLAEDNFKPTELLEFSAAKQRLEKELIFFSLGGTNLIAQQDNKLVSIATELKQLQTMAELLGKRLRVEILGHTDEEGTTEINTHLSQARALTILSLLEKAGVKAGMLSAMGVGTDISLTEKVDLADKQQLNRSVSFKIALVDAEKGS